VKLTETGPRTAVQFGRQRKQVLPEHHVVQSLQTAREEVGGAYGDGREPVPVVRPDPEIVRADVEDVTLQRPEEQCGRGGAAGVEGHQAERVRVRGPVAAGVVVALEELGELGTVRLQDPVHAQPLRAARFTDLEPVARGVLGQRGHSSHHVSHLPQSISP
jgi:hypothetical protein